jgi:xylose isomerase|tara:strand:- start:1533 stop:2849 length:1317 start_codon:yes stop_codon:yes gene_type:complete
MSESFFKDTAKIPFEGPDSDNPLAFRYYDAAQEVLGKSMQDHLRFAVCYWHSFASPGADIFGSGTYDRPWLEDNSLQQARNKMSAAFEFIEKLGVPYFCFHDRDVAPEGTTLTESNDNLDRMTDMMQAEMARTGIKLLWGTANLFNHPRFAAGAATNPDPEVFAYAAAQVKHVLEITHRLGGANYVLWGGREGYDSLLHTDLKREAAQLGRFMQLVVEHKHKIGFPGTILIEPKPHEPTKHQYDYDVAAVYAFLQKFDLQDEIKLNIEANHATLAGHSFQHEIATAAANGLFGSIDINRGDPQNGWDTDQFANSVEEATLVLLEVLKAGGLGNGGFNFDAKIRRQSIARDDLFHAHVGSMDVAAMGLLNAARIIEDGRLQELVDARYAGWQGELGQQMLQGELSLGQIADLVHSRNLNPEPVSGRQEMLENLLNRYLY